jgi:amino acid adenylation domain-containing protein
MDGSAKGNFELTQTRLALLKTLLQERGFGSANGRRIPPRKNNSRLPLSYAQERLWFIEHLEGARGLYNMQAGLRLTGELDEAALRDSLGELVRRHEVLRTRFVLDAGEAVQVIGPWRGVELPVEELSGLDQPEAAVKHWARVEGEQGFDLAVGPLLRTRLLRLSEREHVLLVTMHHIVSDGWSMGIFFRELGELYGARRRGAEARLAELPIQYADFALWQREWLGSGVLEEQLGYWRKQLQGAAGLLELPLDRPRRALPSHRGGKQRLRIRKEVTARLRELSQSAGATLFMTVLGALQVLLYRYSGQSDIAVGTPIANRQRAEVEGLMGFFVNTLVMRTEVNGAESFRELLGRVREVCLGAYAHQDMPFEKLVAELQPERSLTHTPLFQVMMQLQNGAVAEWEMEGLQQRSFEVGSESAKFDLDIHLREDENGIAGVVGYKEELFEAATIARLRQHFAQLLESIVANPDERVGQLQMLSVGEREQLLHEWNDTVVEYQAQCLHEQFAAQVRRTPEAVAVVLGAEEVSYAELNERANRLAHYLRRKGVGPEQLVGICMERSVEMIVGLLGILKAGGAFVPLDASYPRERLHYMLADARVRVLLTEERLAYEFAESGVELVCLGTTEEELAQQSVEDPLAHVSEANLAYVIYTSGSTGRPKGVLINHAGLANVISNARTISNAGTGSVVLQLASLSFDASMLEIFTALSSGAKLCLIKRSLLESGKELGEFIRREGVSMMALAPSLLDVLPEGDYPQLRTIIVGGEACGIGTATTWSRGRDFYNAYAPTEATIYATVGRYEGEDRRPSMGRAIGNMEAYVLDQRQGLVPVGVVGEVYLGGVGLARGYQQRAGETAERFIPHPYSDRAGERLYRTGDLARVRSDGQLEYVGRVDEQVKVRGYRIELGEITTVLRRHPKLRDTAIVAREDRPGERRIVAYVVAEDNSTITASELRGYLREQLPEYMIPAAFVVLDALPLTAHGKVDQRALPVPERDQLNLESTYVAPRTKAETIVSQVWKEVLKLEKVGIHDNFFDLGGHSLLVIQVHNKLREIFKQDLPIVDLFMYTTISSLSERLSMNDQVVFDTSDTTQPRKRNGSRQKQLRQLSRTAQ